MKIGFDVKPSEEIYEIEFDGAFVPHKFSPFWFFNNGLLGEEEAKSANILKVEEDEIMVFSTKFIRIIVEVDKFRIGTAQLLSLDLVKDMAVSISDLLKDSLAETFSYDLQLHISFKDEKSVRKALNSICNGERWNDILTNPQSLSFRVIDEIENEYFKKERMINVYPCSRESMPHTIHLYVFNLFRVKDKKQSVSAFVMTNNDTFKDSINLINKLMKLHFVI